MVNPRVDATGRTHDDSRAWRIRSAGFLCAAVLLSLVLYRTGAVAHRRALETQREWKLARALLPASGCGICGQMAQYNVSRLRKEGGRVVGKIHVGYRCTRHKDAESIQVESGMPTARMLRGLAFLVLGLALAVCMRPLRHGSPHPLWPREKLRPARKASLALCLTLWGSVSVYVLWVGFAGAYLTLPLWMGVGGMLCLWLHELLCGGNYLRCAVCDFEGNLHDVRHFDGACPACGSRLFRVQELVDARRKSCRTTYRYRTMLGLTLDQLEKLEQSGRIWKEPRGAWKSLPPVTAGVA